MHSLDILLFLWVNAGPDTPSAVVALARLVSMYLAPAAALVVGLCAVAGPLAWRRRARGMVVAMVLAWCLVHLMRQMVVVPRPFTLGIGHQWLAHARSSGFPSMHAAIVFALPWMLPALRWRRIQLVLWLLALVVAWSRVCLGLHFPSDVGLGLMVGLVGATLAARAQLALARARLDWRHRRSVNRP